MTKMIVLGPPGAGKGTQAARLAEHFGIPTISTGALFRSHMKTGSELGELARSYIDKGNLVPDEVTTRMLAERLQADDVAQGFILDGYPRNLAQAAALDGILGSNGIDSVVDFEIRGTEIVKRLLARAAIEGRSDDTEEVIRHRLKVYREQTAPLQDHYAERGLLVPVDAVGSVEDVAARTIVALGAR
ncbi:MAG: adenylate kinase [Ruaniaceae bacterium]|nr:adenylate kinase [Ruaniaceae bacterium]